MNSSVKTALLIIATAAVVGGGAYLLATRKREEAPVRSTGAPYLADQATVRSSALATATAALQNAPPAASVPAPTTPAAAAAAAPPAPNPLQQITNLGKGIGDFVQSASGAFNQVKGFLDGLHLFGA